MDSNEIRVDQLSINSQFEDQQHVQILEQPFLDEENQQNVRVPTNLFCNLLKEFKLYYIISIAVNLLLSTLFTVQFFRQCNDYCLTMWMLYAAIIFFIQFIFYNLVIVPSFNKRQTYNFAEQLNEVLFEGEEDPYNQLSRKLKIKKRKRIENLICSHFKNYYKAYWYIDMFLIINNLGLVVIGIIFFSLNNYFQHMFDSKRFVSNSQDCEFSTSWITFWSIVLICVSRKKAFQVLLLIIIAMPVFLCYIPIKLMKQDKKKQSYNKQCLKVLKSLKYHPNTISGDEHQCSICQMDYSMTDNIKILPCSNLHHFHSSCIKAWFNISPTCPLCRKELGKIIEDIRSNNGIPSYLVLDASN